MAFYNDLKTRIEAGFPVIYIETAEAFRCADEIMRCCDDCGKSYAFWNRLHGLRWVTDDKEETEEMEFPELIEILSGKDSDKSIDQSVVVLEYADTFLADKDLAVMFAVMLRSLHTSGHQVIVVSPQWEIPIYIQKEVALLDFDLPDRDAVKALLNNRIRKKFPSIEEGSIHDNNAILDSVRGLGTTEILNAFAKVAVEHGKITAEQIPHLVAEKEQIIRKSGYLEFCPTDESIDSIGGLELLKEWLKKREKAFGGKYNLNPPKGVLLLGIPGTGKSLSAKAVARQWKMPLLRLDMGRIFGGLVGESESNIRNAIKVAESMAPCVLWVDEIEKGLSSGAGGERDGGTSSRVFGAFLTWMQEKTKEVFVFATANNIEHLPAELLRKGRFDEIFFVDLPDGAARKDIFEIHLQRKGQEANASLIDDGLLDATEGFSGAEIESIVNEALFEAVAESKSDSSVAISSQNLHNAAKIVPLSATMDDVIVDLRKWAEHRCKKASAASPPTLGSKQKDKKAPRLLQEVRNMFAKDSEKD